MSAPPRGHCRSKAWSSVLHIQEFDFISSLRNDETLGDWLTPTKCSRHWLINQKANLLMYNEKHYQAGQDMLLCCFEAPFGKSLPREDSLKNTDSEKGSLGELGSRQTTQLFTKCMPAPPSVAHTLLQPVITTTLLPKHTLPHSLLVKTILITNINNLLNAYYKLSTALNSFTCIVSFNLPSVVR